MSAPASFHPAGNTAWLCTGKVMHERQRPVMHRFVYPVSYAVVPLHADLAALDRVASPWLGSQSFRAFSIQPRDHGARDGSPLLPWFRALLLQKMGADAAASIQHVWLQTFPRTFGVAFNPVSFWFAYAADGHLRAVLAEVSNTFGEHHNYLIIHPDLRPIADGDIFQRDKVFHVSPFFPVRGHYQFRFALAGGLPQVRIDYADDRGTLLRTAIAGKPEPLTVRSARSAVLRFPFLTLGVLWRIHWQAARLYFEKRVEFFKKPQPPIEETT